MDTDPKQTTSLLGLRIVLIASVLLFLVATLSEVYRAPLSPTTAPPPTERSAQDRLIVPGTRVGPVTLGLSVQQVSAILGKPILRPHEKGTLHLYEEAGLVVYAEDDRVSSITVRSPLFATRRGVRVGSDVSEVLSTLGRDYEMEGTEDDYVLHNFSQGWHIGVKDDLVTYFQVTPILLDGASPAP